MPASSPDQPSPTSPDNEDLVKPVAKADKTFSSNEPSHPTQNVDRPEPGEQPLGFLRLLVILMASHIGVRSRANREEDFRRANGLHVFIAAIIYFLLIICVLILLVNIIID